jgi:hypothetical protein
MKSIFEIQEQLKFYNFEFTRLALIRIIERNISEAEIQQIHKNARIIEDYPEDKYSPSCLILGFTDIDRPLHIQVSRNISTCVRIITVYEPSEQEWIEYRSRKK